MHFLNSSTAFTISSVFNEPPAFNVSVPVNEAAIYVSKLHVYHASSAVYNVNGATPIASNLSHAANISSHVLGKLSIPACSNNEVL